MSLISPCLYFVSYFAIDLFISPSRVCFLLVSLFTYLCLSFFLYFFSSVVSFVRYFFMYFFVSLIRYFFMSCIISLARSFFWSSVLSFFHSFFLYFSRSYCLYLCIEFVILSVFLSYVLYLCIYFPLSLYRYF